MKISIIGAGSVGSTIAYALMLRNIAAEIRLIDIDQVRCRGEILDLSDALSFCGPFKIEAGSAQDAKESDIIILAAGKKQEPGQDRIALLQANKKITQEIFEKIKPLAKNTVVIVVTNPVDAITYFAQEYSGLPKSQVFGSGTFLDTQRLRGEISQKVNIAEQSIHAYILGEHGDSQFAAWSCARIAGMPISEFGMSNEELELLAQKAKDKAYEIIACKGSTFYGIAICVAALCRTILFNQNRVTPVSCYSKQYDICLSQPVVLGRMGITEILDLPLDQNEQILFAQSAQAIKKMITL